MERFRMYLVREEKSELTVEKYVRDVRKFLSWLGAEELTKEKVLAYRGELLDAYAVVSANSMISAVNTYLSFIDRADCCVKVVRQQRRMFLSEEKELTKAEYRRLLKAAERKPRLCLLMQTICSMLIWIAPLQRWEAITLMLPAQP